MVGWGSYTLGHNKPVAPVKAFSTNLYKRGAKGNFYLRMRIPTALRTSFDGKEHITRSLRTTELATAKQRLAHAESEICKEFDGMRLRMSLDKACAHVRTVRNLSDVQAKAIGHHWTRTVLQSDEQRRRGGMTNEEFEALQIQLDTSRAAFRRALAQGNTAFALPEIQEFLVGCGIRYCPNEQEIQRSCYTLLQSRVESIDYQLKRQAGEIVYTDVVAPPVKHPLQILFPESAPRDSSTPTWEQVFKKWQDQVINRPMTTVTAFMTPWRELQSIARDHRLISPNEVEELHIEELVERMKERGLKSDTIGDRLLKLRHIFRAARKARLIQVNPAIDIECPQDNNVRKRRKRRLAFSNTDLHSIFSSAIFVKQLRSKGQSGEATYWIPILMYYTGARPEEIAGLALNDLRHEEGLGWIFSMVDRPCIEDRDLFAEDDDVPETHWRTLKSDSSIRQIPVANELIELGLLKYVQWVKDQGHSVMFPTLKKDAMGKLSSAFGKFFGRFKSSILIEGPLKVLYSFRHNMKNHLEAAKVPSKYLKRILGHVSGDGAVTDGYGDDLPIEFIVNYFQSIQFPPIPAMPWEPGKGYFRIKKSSSKRKEVH